MAIRLNPSRRSGGSSSSSQNRSSSPAPSELSNIQRELRSGDPRRVLRAQAELAKYQTQQNVERARSSGGGAPRTIQQAAEPGIGDVDAVASTVGPRGEPAVVRQAGFSTQFQGGAGVGAQQFVQNVGPAPSNINPATGRPFGTVQPSSLGESSRAQSFVAGATNLFTNPQEAGRVLRSPVTAGPNAPPALQAAAREDFFAGIGAGAALGASLAPVGSGRAAVGAATPVLRRAVPTIAPFTVRYVAPRAPAALTFGSGLVESSVIGFAAVRGAQIIEEKTRPEFTGVSRSQLSSAFRAGQTEVIERQPSFLGISAGEIASPFSSGRATQEATFRNLVAQGVPPSEAAFAARSVTSRSRTIVGGTEIASQTALGKTTEIIGRNLIANRFSFLAGKGITVRNTLTGRASQVVAPIFVAGGVEGGASTTISIASRTGRRPTLPQFGTGVVLGAAVAGPLGGLIAAPKSAAGRSIVEVPANVLDPFEAPGDIAAEGFEARIVRRGGRVRTPSFVEQNNRVGFSVSETSAGPVAPVSRVVAVTPSASFTSAPVSTLASSRPSSRVSPASLVSPRTTPSSSTPVSPIASVPATTRTTVPVSTRTSVPATTRTTVPVSTVTPRIGLPIIPPGGGVGGGFRFPGSGGRRKAGYAPSVAAVAFGVTGRGRAQQFTGLEFRPIVSRAPRSNALSRFAA